MDLSNKTAIITGGARGLGFGFAEALLQRGANVVMVDILVKTGIEAAKELGSLYPPGKVMFMKCDVTNKEELSRLFKTVKEQYGHIDIVANNAGISNETNWRKMVDINLSAVIHGTLLALEYMNMDNGGRGGLIVNTGSTAGLTPVAFEPIYAATKYGVVGFTRSVAARPGDTTDQGIRVVCLCPSFTQTPILKTSNFDDETLSSVMGMGIMKRERVVEAFMKMVDNPDNNGGVLSVIPDSMVYKHPKHLRGKL